MHEGIGFGRVSDGVYYFSGFEDDVGAGFVATSEGIVVVDTTMLQTSAGTFLGIIGALYPDEPVHTIINTHVHCDHHFGNEVFVERFPHAKIIAHERLAGILKELAAESGEDVSKDLPRRLMRREDSRSVYYRSYFKDARVVLPTKTVKTDHELEIGGTEIRLLHTPGHTEDHLAVYLPRERVLFAGDLIYTTMSPPPLFMGDPDAWIETLGRLRSLDIDVLLPGHGRIPEDPKAEIEGHIETLRSVKRGVLEAIRGAGDPIPYKELEQKIGFLRGRYLQGVIRALVRRGIIEADREEIPNARLKLSGVQ